MIGGAGAPTSVAPGASLYSAGFIHPFAPEDGELLTTQYLAKRYQFTDNRHIRVINHSWGDFSGVIGPYDGNSRLTLGVDWIASRFDVLNVVAGNYDIGPELPKDNFNGITIAFTDNNFRRVDVRNDNEDEFDAAGDRVSVDLLAPGAEGIELATKGGVTIDDSYGTSLAAPHVTGAVALLDEYSDYQILANEPRWDLDNPRRHEVMKAVLLNSADKNVADEGGTDWDDSIAFHNDQVSLDQQMGAGLLDAGRALDQFKSGEYNNGEQVPPIGWDYGETEPGVFHIYPLAEEFAGGFVTATLAWDRGVTKFGGLNDTFEPSNIFAGDPVANLDLFILPVGWTDPYADAEAMSISSEDNVEHIYKEIPPGDYEIVVYHAGFDGEPDFGLAWWFGNPVVPGDFDTDGDVDGADLNEWRFDYALNADSDADGDGDSDGADFLAWQRNLGAGLPAVPAAESVPEPNACALFALGLPLVRARRQRRGAGKTRPAALPHPGPLPKGEGVLVPLFLAAIALAALARPATAAEITLTRNSRTVTSAEVAGGAPSDALVHDFLVTSDADLLSVLANVNVSVYQHPYGNDHSAPHPELVALFPALAANSFLRLPSDTLVLGGGFNGPGPDRIWGDLVNDGPQTNFLFGRLTTSQTGSFAGRFSVRGSTSVVDLPFTMNLPGPGESLLGSFNEKLSLSASEPIIASPAPVIPTKFDPSVNPPHPTATGSVSIELTRRSRPVSNKEIAFGAPAGYVHEFFVTTSTDLISIDHVDIDAPLYQNPHGSSRKPPNERVLRLWPSASADSYITTPGETLGMGGGFYGKRGDQIAWFDHDDTGALEDFLFARLTTGETGHFSGEIFVEGPEKSVGLPFDFLLPGTEADLAKLDEEQSYRLELSFDDLEAIASGQVPEPAGWLLGVVGLRLLLTRRPR